MAFIGKDLQYYNKTMVAHISYYKVTNRAANLLKLLIF